MTWIIVCPVSVLSPYQRRWSVLCPLFQFPLICMSLLESLAYVAAARMAASQAAAASAPQEMH